MSNKNVNVRKSQEITFCLLAGILMFMAMMVAGRAEAGVALGATRVIYPAGQKQSLKADNGGCRAAILPSRAKTSATCRDK